MGNKATAAMLLATFIIGMTFVFWVVQQGIAETEFRGACTVKGGEVHDDLCIKDGVVVLDKSTYKE